MWRTLLVFAGVAVVLLVFSVRAGPSEERYATVVASDSRVEQALGEEVKKLRLLLAEQQRASVEQSKLLQELQQGLKAQSGPSPQAASPAAESAPTITGAASLLGAAAVAAPPSVEALATVAAAERRALEQVPAVLSNRDAT